MWIEYLRIAWSCLRGHSLRSLLTVLSILVGSFSIVLMLSLAESAMVTLASQVEEIGGARLISLWRKVPESMEGKQALYLHGITRQDVELLRRIPHVKNIASFVKLRGRSIYGDNGKSTLADVIAADSEFLSFFHYRIAEGRMLDLVDAEQHSRVCILGSALAEKLFGNKEAVLSRLVRVSGFHCRIVGQMAKIEYWGLDFAWDWNNVLVMPLPTLGDHDVDNYQNALRAFLLTDAPSQNVFVKRSVNALLLARHHGVDDFSMFDFNGRVEQFYQLFFMMKVIIGLLASIALLVGGVGIMNIMLVSVSERIREIGIRRALGATPADISWQFLVEAALLSGGGGLLGSVLGCCGTIASGLIIQQFKPIWMIQISIPAVLLAIAAAVLTGMFFGYVPAKNASLLDPVTAIRTK